MNKKILSLILMCTMGFASLSAQELVIKKKDGSAQTVGGKLYFKQKGDTDKWSVTTDANGEYSSANDISKLRNASVLDGIDYIQYYLGIRYIDPSDLFVSFTVDTCHLVFE